MPIVFTGSPYSQNFDTLASTGSSVPWTNDITLDGWYLFRQPSPGTAITSFDAGDGQGAAGSFYSFGTSGSSDRALGGVGSGGSYFGSPTTGNVAGWIAFAATNTTGSTITSVTVGFDGEQWRNGGNTSAQEMVLEYGFGATFSAVSSWTAPGAGFSWTSPIATGTAAALDGNASANRVANVGGTLSIPTWDNGTTMWFRWVERNDSGNDHGLAIDNFSLSAVAPPAAPSVTLSVNPASGTEAAQTAVTVTATASAAVVGNQTVSLAVSGTGITAGDYTLSNTTITIPNGATTGSVTFTIVDDSAIEGTETAVLTLSNPSAGITLGSTITQNVTITDNDAPPVRIADIQGAAHRSPLLASATDAKGVTGVQGIVTAIASNGFYIQDPLPDANPGTSEGIFVFTGTGSALLMARTLGEAVQVSGTVSEFRPAGNADNLTITQIGNNNSVQQLAISAWTAGVGLSITPTVIGAGGRVPPTAVISDDAAGGSVENPGTLFDPANDGIDFWESLEGMQVQVNNPVAVSPTNGFGEIWLLGDDGTGATGRTDRGGVLVSPGDFNPERIQIDGLRGTELIPAVDVGAKLSAITGVVSYSFENYEVLVSQAPTVVQASTLTREVTPLVPTPNQLTVATFNVENLDPGDPASKFSTIADRIVNNLRRPDILSLEEVQDNSGPTNNGVVAADVTIQTLIDAIVTAGGPRYQFRQIDPVNNQDGGEPGGNIRVVFLFNPDRVSFVEGSLQRLTDTNLADGDAFAASRKPLAGDFRFNGETITVVGNHFNSKGGDDPLFGPTQPPVLSTEAQRVQQATIVKDFVLGKLAANPQAKVLVAGDLNDFEFSAPLTVLEGAGLTTLIERLPENQRYTYNFEGNSQALDHILASPGLTGLLDGFDVVHVNSEFATQVSDHDPVVARFNIAAPGQTLTGTPGRDQLAGTPGNDVITGGPGRDLIVAGAGSDRIVFTGLIDFFDVVLDFSSAAGDKIDVRPLLASVGYTGGNPIADGYLSLVSSVMPALFGTPPVTLATSALFDIDGSAGPELPRLMVQVVGVNLTETDFLFGGP
jgi:predicted extracellular nuclease